MDSLQYGTTTYKVEKLPPQSKFDLGLPSYRLSGPRGAQYRTMRNRNNTSLMFLINERSFLRSTPFEWLHEKDDGTLEVVR